LGELKVQLFDAQQLAEVLTLHKIPVVAAREGSLDVESEVQVTNSMSVTTSLLDGSFSIFELLNDDPDAIDFRISKRYNKVTDVIRAVKAKLGEDKNAGRQQRC
jgi:hypothetical protein